MCRVVGLSQSISQSQSIINVAFAPTAISGTTCSPASLVPILMFPAAFPDVSCIIAFNNILLAGTIVVQS